MSPRAASLNSTNVRNTTAGAPREIEDTRATIAAALALWAAAAVAASAAGVFTKLPPELGIALSVFAAAFAAAAYWLDEGVRRFAADRRPALVRMLGSLAALGLLDLAAGPRDAALLAWPHAVVLLFALPLAVAIGAALLDPRAARVRSSGSRSPAATPAAT